MTADLVAKIHDTPAKGVIAITGCSPGIVTKLLQYGGGSSTLLEAVVPYHTKALVSFIKQTPKKFCSEGVALELASKAFSRATELEPDAVMPFGLGCTATLRKNGPEREDRVHQAFVSFQTQEETHTYHITFKAEHRLVEDHFLTKCLLNILSDRVGLEEDPGPNPSEVEVIAWNHSVTTHDPLLKKLLKGEEKAAFFPSVVSQFDDQAYDNQPPVLMPGSFNPIHEGHRGVVKTAYDYFEGQRPIYLELSLSNVDKGKLSAFEIQKRLTALIEDPEARWNGIFVTNAPTFVEKATTFMGATFVIGIDTWYRLNDSKYSNYSVAKCKERLARIKS